MKTATSIYALIAIGAQWVNSAPAETAPAPAAPCQPTCTPGYTLDGDFCKHPNNGEYYSSGCPKWDKEFNWDSPMIYVKEGQQLTFGQILTVLTKLASLEISSDLTQENLTIDKVYETFLKSLNDAKGQMEEVENAIKAAKPSKDATPKKDDAKNDDILLTTSLPVGSETCDDICSFGWTTEKEKASCTDPKSGAYYSSGCPALKDDIFKQNFMYVKDGQQISFKELYSLLTKMVSLEVSTDLTEGKTLSQVLASITSGYGEIADEIKQTENAIKAAEPKKDDSAAEPKKDDSAAEPKKDEPPIKMYDENGKEIPMDWEKYRNSSGDYNIPQLTAGAGQTVTFG